MSSFVPAVSGNRTRLPWAKHLGPHRFRFALVCVYPIVVLAAGTLRAQVEPAPAGTGPTAGVAPAASRFVAESRETVKRLHEKMASLGAQVLAPLDTDGSAEGYAASQGIVIESAKAGYQLRGADPRGRRDRPQGV